MAEKIYRQPSEEMEPSQLVQRLRKPMGATAFGKDNPFAFGGGRKNGGLSDEAMDLLRDIFSFDYMGAAEFEFGAVPAALHYIAEHAEEMQAWSLEIDFAKVAPVKPWEKKPNPEGKSTVYAMCLAGDRDEVERRIRWFAEHSFEGHPYRGRKGFLKESTNLNWSLLESDDTYRPQGWLELNNGYMFFTNEDMWRSTCKLFGVTPE